jgi:phospholipid-binding lipoprotein MlaA
VSIVLSSRAIGRWISVVVVLAASVLGGCAPPPPDPAERAAFIQNNDPLEPLNRKTLALNQFLDKIIFKPAAQTYVAVFPGDARLAIHHVLDNMKEPTLFFNNLLQGDLKRAGISLGRFAVNSTVGFGGMVDVMTLSGVDRQTADFGQTLFAWGVPSGPYLILPIVGPSNPRDAVGATVDSYDDPFTILANQYGVTELITSRLVVGGVDERAGVLDELDDLEKNSVDFYAQLRSLSQQHRNAELHHGDAPAAEPGLYNDPGRPQPPRPASPPKSGATKAPVTQTAAVPSPIPHPVDPDEGPLR